MLYTLKYYTLTQNNKWLKGKIRNLRLYQTGDYAHQLSEMFKDTKTFMCKVEPQ